MKIIIDTNVFVSGIFWAGPPYKILKAWQANKVSLIISQEIFEEYERVGNELSKRYSSVNLVPMLQLVAIYAEVHIPVALEQQVSRDPDDDKFIACALAASVKSIVSGDRDLLSISGYRGIEILTPAQFVSNYLIN